MVRIFLIAEIIFLKAVQELILGKKNEILRNGNMERKKLITILQGLLNTQENLDFLLKLTVEDLEKMVGIVRERIEG